MFYNFTSQFPAALLAHSFLKGWILPPPNARLRALVLAHCLATRNRVGTCEHSLLPTSRFIMVRIRDAYKVWHQNSGKFKGQLVSLGAAGNPGNTATLTLSGIYVDSRSVKNKPPTKDCQKILQYKDKAYFLTFDVSTSSNRRRR